jgi:hypothetical protein
MTVNTTTATSEKVIASAIGWEGETPPFSPSAKQSCLPPSIV